jgi:hypothetical protein
MTKTIMMFGATAAMAVLMATPSFAQNRSNNPRDAYAQSYGSNTGCTRLCGPPQAAGFWQPGLCWVDQDKSRRLGYFEACKR